MVAPWTRDGVVRAYEAALLCEDHEQERAEQRGAADDREPKGPI
jgi:hypothetical protein